MDSSRLPVRASAAIGAVALVAVVAGIAVAFGLPPGGTFVDDDGNLHEGNIEAIAADGVTSGCNPPANDRYCPATTVTRGQMAAFLVRAVDLPATAIDSYHDDDASVFENDINRLAAAGITKGCNPPANDHFCPDSRVTRGQMAAFLVRAMGYKDNGGGDLYVDDDGHLFENAIDKLGTAKVTLGCNPPVNDKFCPDDHVTRGQMAAFLTRALGLTSMKPPPRETTTTSVSTTTTTTSTTTTTTKPNCDPAYPDFCIPPPPPDLNCSDIPQKNFTVFPPDPHGFDGNNNGIGCES